MSRFRGVGAACAALLLLAGVAHATDALELEAVGRLEVGPDGAVREYALETELTPGVAALVDRAVRGWRFEPVRVDGRAVTVTSRMRLELEALPRGDDYVLRVADVILGEPDPVDLPPPAYPTDALRDGVGARVVMLLQVDAAGNVEDVHIEQVSLSGRPGKRADYFRGRFADASRRAALDWTYAMGEHVDGGPVAGRFRVPVTFEAAQRGDWSERPVYVPGPYHPSPWAEPGAAGPDADAPANGKAQPLDPRLKLQEDVIGATL